MVRDNITVQNGKIGFRNFAGKESKYNAEGNRNFCWFIEDSELAARLKEDGWNVKYTNPRDEEDDPKPYLQVSVKFGQMPPKLVLVSSGGKTVLEEDQVNTLDWTEIANVDFVIRPYNWEVNGKSGVKAYLKTMYITVVEDVLEDKYKDIPDRTEPPFGNEEEEPW